MYPSLEDLKVGQVIQAHNTIQQQYQSSGYGHLNLPFARSTAYPALADMGLNLSADEMALISVATINPASSSGYPSGQPSASLVAPLSSQSVGLQRAQVTHGVREVILCKDHDNKLGLKVQSINKGVFIVLVKAGSPAALVGLRFGDQILQIGGENVAGYSSEKVHSMLKSGPPNGIILAVRDRPFERTLTLHKDQFGHVGFQYKNGKIIAVVVDSSAARNGLLTEHQLLEVDGQNVVGLPDKEIHRLIESASQVVTFTVMPSLIYDHLIKNTASSIIKKLMDHSIPAL